MIFTETRVKGVYVIGLDAPGRRSGFLLRERGVKRSSRHMG